VKLSLGVREVQTEMAVTDRRESVAGVGDKHASLADGTVTNGDTLDEPGGTHCCVCCREDRG